MLIFAQKYKHWLLIIIGSLVWSVTMVKSGWVYDYGMGFWGPNGHDGIWHISLINSLARGSFEMPIFSGETIRNYHIGFDLLLAIIKKITFIPAHILYFQIVPPLLAVGIGLAVYNFVNNWQKSASAAWWATFFTYFGTSWGWLVNLVRVKDLGGESMFWAQQSISTLINPPFAVSVLILFVGLGFLQQKKFWPAIISLALLSQIKVYAAILLFAVWFVAAVWQKEKYLLKAWCMSLVISLAIFLPLNSESQNMIVWQPGWFLETMLAVSDRLNWPRFYEAMINYRLADNWPKAIAAYLVAFSFFIFGNLGTRVIGILQLRFKSFWDLFILGFIGLGFILPMLILQTGTPWNTIQFSYYSLIFAGILAGVSLSKINNKILIGIVLVSGILGTVGTLMHYLPSRPPAQIAKRELEALHFLATQPVGVVLTVPFDRSAAQAAVNNPPRPLFLYESTAYVSAFTNKPVFLEDEVNLNITGYDWQSRRLQVADIFASNNADEIRNFWQTNNISYVYFLPDSRFMFGDSELGAEQIFDNGQFMIWKIN